MKSAGEIFLSGLRGAKKFSNTFRIVFRIFFRVFQTVFSHRFKSFSGAASFCRHAALTLCHLPREARDLIFKIRSYSARSDLKNKRKNCRKYLNFKIRSYSARSDLKNEIPRFSGLVPSPYPKHLFGLFLTFRVISNLQGYFWRPSENTL